MINDIQKQIRLIGEAIAWADKHGKDGFPRKSLREDRRQLRKIANALSENCSAAAYGESQVGKSYLMSSLLSSPSSPFVIENGGRRYRFVDDLNPSGGNSNSKTESTGVITRFTMRGRNERMANFIKIKNLSVADIIMMLVDSYYNDLKLDSSRMLKYDEINNALLAMADRWGKGAPVQEWLGYDDVMDICDYIRDVLPSAVANQSQFRSIVADKIKYASPDEWPAIFSLLWNNNRDLTELFALLVSEYSKLGFRTEVYVPFDAVLKSKGTLLKVDWLDQICEEAPAAPNPGEEPLTDVYDADGNLLAQRFGKPSLSALIAELTFFLPDSVAEDRKFLRKLDLLDFPGARSREKIDEKELRKVLPTILRRGKIAYLFNKYSRSLMISSVLFCHHNDQKTVATLGSQVSDWIKGNIGSTPSERVETLLRTRGISPLFFVATKFNMELQRGKDDFPAEKELLDEHWKRFKTVIPEIIKPESWFESWVEPGALSQAPYFRSIYPLRDFYFSGKNRVFTGYEEFKSAETGVYAYPDYPGFLDDLRANFVANDFVIKHFAHPEEAWQSFATPNNDGSKVIIRDLDKISDVLDQARRDRYMAEAVKIKDDVISKISPYYEPADKNEKNERIRKIIGEMRLRLDNTVGERPETFGRIIDSMMIQARDLYHIAHDIIILRRETPVDFNGINLIRQGAGVNINDSRERNVDKLCDRYGCFDEAELADLLKTLGYTVDDIVSTQSGVATTVAELVAGNIVSYWRDFITDRASRLKDTLPYNDEVAHMLHILCDKLGVKDVITKRIDEYAKSFSEVDSLYAIADFASLTLNNFVSSVGIGYMTDSDTAGVIDKAMSCRIRLRAPQRQEQRAGGKEAMVEALQAFDDANDIDNVSIATLMRLPFWSNFQAWETALVFGLFYVSDIAQCDPVANAAMQKIIVANRELYKPQSR